MKFQLVINDIFNNSIVVEDNVSQSWNSTSKNKGNRTWCTCTNCTEKSEKNNFIETYQVIPQIKGHEMYSLGIQQKLK